MNFVMTPRREPPSLLISHVALGFIAAALLAFVIGVLGGCGSTAVPPPASPGGMVAEAIVTLGDVRTMNRSALNNTLISRAQFDANRLQEDRAESMLLEAERLLESGGTPDPASIDSARTILVTLQTLLPKPKGP